MTWTPQLCTAQDHPYLTCPPANTQGRSGRKLPLCRDLALLPAGSLSSGDLRFASVLPTPAQVATQEGSRHAEKQAPEP